LVRVADWSIDVGARRVNGHVTVEWRTSVHFVGTVVKYLSAALVVPLLVALYYGQDAEVFVAAIVVALSVGLLMERAEDDPDLGAREGFLLVGLSWLAVAAIGMVPYVLAGWGTASTLADPVNALFESMSGFTTTGATVMGEISVDRHSRALLLWRQLTQWLGGMGIVVLAVAILPELSVGGAQLMDAEAPGPGIEKLTPRIAATARALWVAYAGITALEIVLLYALHQAGMADGMTLYNAVAHGLTTMPTGGFSPEARSIEAFSAAVQWLVIPFMLTAGVNFALVWHVLSGEPRRLFGDAEFRFYLGALGTVTAVLAGLLFTGGGLAVSVPADASLSTAYLDSLRGDVIGTIEPALRHAVFQAVSIVTTTGYANVDFNAWSEPARYALLAAMFVGGSAGSTGGAVKIVRWLVILKAVRRELVTTVHPDAVRPVRLGGRALDERAIRGIFTFTLLYLVLFFVGTLVVALDAARVGADFSTLEAMSSVAATLGNVGPAFGALGPMNNYLPVPDTSKLFMVGLMWAGRLEVLPVLVLLTRAYWRS
jgi:trk system potassium uptake protein TrkH